MSALSDVENLRLHDISNGDVRDDPRWLALMGEGALKAFLAEMAAKHLPGQHNQDSHGNDHGGIDVPNPLDKLKLGKRAPAGFTVRSSKKIKTDYADVGIAEVDSPDGPQVRVGVIGNESGKWDAGFTGESRKAELRQEIARKQALMDSDSDDVDDDIEDQISELRSELEDLEGERTAIVSPEAMADFRRQLGEGLEVAKANKAKVDADAKAQDAIDGKRAAIIAEFSDAEMERGIHELSWRLRQAQGIVRDLENDLASGRSRHGWDPEFTAERLASWKEKVAKYEAELAPLLARRAELMPPDARARLEDLDRQFNALNDVAIDDMLTAAEVSAPNGARIRAEIWGSDDEDEQWVSTRLYVLTPGETSDDIDDDYGSFRGLRGLNRLIAGLESSGDLPKSSRRDTQNKHLPRQVRRGGRMRRKETAANPAVVAVIRDLRALRRRLSGALRDELDGIIAALTRIAANPPAKHGNHDQRTHGRRRSGVLGSVLDDLASLRDKLSDDDRSVLDKAMAKLRNLESSDVDDDDLIEDELDEEEDGDDEDASDLVMDSASGEVTFTPYADGDIDVDWEDGGFGLRLSPQSSREVADAVAEFAKLPVAQGQPPTPSDRPDWVTDQDSYRRWINQLAEQWAESEAGQRHNGIAGEMTTSDGEWKVVRFGGGVTWIGDPETVDSEDGSGSLQLDDSGEANQFANLLRDAIVIAGLGPQAGKSASKGASMATTTRSRSMNIKTMRTSGFQIKNADRGEFSAVLATLNVIDSDGDVTRPGAFDSSDFPLSAYGHKSWEGALPVGIGRVKEVGNEAILEGHFFMDTTHGRDTFLTVKRLGPLGQWSYGYDPVGHSNGMHEGKSVRFLEKLKVHEASPVLVGAGVGTRTLGTKGRSMTSSGRSRAVKGAIPSHETKTVSRAWDRVRTEAALPDDARPSDFRSVYAYVDPDGDPELKASYSFPHHHGIGGPANLRACLMGIASLNGPAGADMGEPERKGIYDHLAAHLKDADRDIPDLRTGPGDNSKSRFSDEAATVLAAVSGLIDRASEVMALRQRKGKGMAGSTADLLGWVSDEMVRLKHLLSNPVEPEIPQPDDDEVASVIAASIARLNGI